MAWTPPSDAVEAPVTKQPAWTPPSDAVEAAPAPAPAPAAGVAPGWFEPGSKSAAVARGFSQGATLGFGDEIQALVRGLTTGRGYTAVRDEERDANALEARANPGAYLAGNAAAALVGAGAAAVPARLGVSGLKQVASLTNLPARTLPRVLGQGAALGGVTGLGYGEGSAGSQVGTGLAGAALGIIPGVAARVATPIRKAAATAAGTNLTNSTLQRASVAPTPLQQASAGTLLGGLTGLATTGSVEGALLGAVTGGAGGALGPFGARNANVIRAVSNVTPRTVGTALSAGGLGVLALTQTAARDVISTAEQEVQRKVEQGQPMFAATFTALNNPVVRQALKTAEDDDQDEQVLLEE